MKTDTIQVLKNHRLRVTDCRVSVLEYFLENPYAVSHSNLERIFKDNFDRVTLYRTLTSFVEKGLIHKVLDDSESTKYAACESQCHPESHQDDHVHFKCKECGKTTCVSNVPIPDINLPKGYKASGADLLITGKCPNC